MSHTWDMGIMNMFTSMDLNTGLVPLNRSPAHLRPPKRLTCAQNNCVGLINQPFRLGTGDWGVRGGDWGLIHGDVLQ